MVALLDAIQFAVGLRDADAILEPRGDKKPVIAAIVHVCRGHFMVHSLPKLHARIRIIKPGGSTPITL